MFANPFHIDDLAVFDDDTLRDMLASERGPEASLAPCMLALALRDVPAPIAMRVAQALPVACHADYEAALRTPAAPGAIEAARRHVLDSLFWELTYWKTPELYERLTEGEDLHPGIFQRLAPFLRDRVVLDAGAGSGRATLECVRHGARYVYAIEPSPGLRRILARKLAGSAHAQRITIQCGRFEHLPLPDRSVDVALSCAAFTSEPRSGGEAGLAELRRVARPGGLVVLVWPRPEDRDWLAVRGFSYEALPLASPMRVHYRSLAVALRIAHRFYAHNTRLARYLRRARRPDVPCAILGMNPPNDYCWLRLPPNS